MWNLCLPERNLTQNALKRWKATWNVKVYCAAYSLVDGFVTPTAVCVLFPLSFRCAPFLDKWRIRTEFTLYHYSLWQGGEWYLLTFLPGTDWSNFSGRNGLHPIPNTLSRLWIIYKHRAPCGWTRFVLRVCVCVCVCVYVCVYVWERERQRDREICWRKFRSVGQSTAGVFFCVQSIAFSPLIVIDEVSFLHVVGLGSIT